MKKTILALFVFISLAAAGQEKKTELIPGTPEKTLMDKTVYDTLYRIESINFNDFFLLWLALKSNNRKVTPEQVDALIEWIEKRLKKVPVSKPKEQPK